VAVNGLIDGVLNKNIPLTASQIASETIEPTSEMGGTALKTNAMTQLSARAGEVSFVQVWDVPDDDHNNEEFS